MFEGLINLLIYIKDNTTLGLNYYADMNDSLVSTLLRQSNIKTDTQLMVSLILVGNIIKTLAELQEHILYFINVGQLTMATMLQDQFLNQVQKVSTMQHVLQ